MGKNNSSKYRVKPLMDYMLENHSKLSCLLKTVNIEIFENSFCNDDIYYEGHNGEKALKPSCDYLCKIIEDLPNNEYALNKIKAQKSVERKNLIRNLEEQKKAICKIKSDYNKSDVLRGKIYLEGSSKPDVFIETKNSIIVVEGKWTEKSITKSTTYVKNRNQMVRHIHAALNYKNIKCLDKQVYGFYVVSDEFAQKEENVLDSSGFKKMLESQFGIEELKEQIAEAYKGYITWEYIENLFPELANKWKKRESL